MVNNPNTITTWIAEQSTRSVHQFDRAMANAYPSSGDSLESARSYLDTIGGVCNYLDAIDLIDWTRLVPRSAQVLDMGCGGGWLTAKLSKLDEVALIHALDSSHHFLHALLPDVVRLMEGRPERINVVEALFQPLLFDDSSLDLVVSSSALHHAENLQRVLSEIRRVLRPGGRLLILNETPRPGYRHCLSVTAAAIRILRDLILRRYFPVAPAISAAGFLYDPHLGDRDYPLWYWQRAIEQSGFFVDEIIDTGLPTIRGGPGRPLIHFVCTVR